MGHVVMSLKLDKFKFIQEIRKTCIINRVADEWISLCCHVVGANKINTFRKELNKPIEWDARCCDA